MRERSKVSWSRLGRDAAGLVRRAETQLKRRARRQPEPTRRTSVLRMARFPLLGAVGWAIGWLTDPTSGRARRQRLAQRSQAVVRRGTRRARSKSMYVRGRAMGRVARMRGGGEPHPVDDVDIKQQVRMCLSRAGFSRGDVLIDVCNGTVTLRGELSDEGEITRAETIAADAPGVVELVSDLHVPGQSARPHHKVVALHAS